MDKMAAAEGSGGGVAIEALTEVTVSKCLSVKLPEVAALAQVWQVTPFFSLCEGHCSLSLLSETPSSRSRTLEGLFELTRHTFKGHQCFRNIRDTRALSAAYVAR